jgi:uncharacterized membrane protein YdfJ with MMPL/SSD domain
MGSRTVNPPTGPPPGSTARPPAHASPLLRLTRLVQRRARPVLFATLSLAAAAAALGAGVANRLDPYEAAGAATQSATAATTIEHATGLELGAGVIVLVHTPTGAYTAAGTTRVREIEHTIRGDREVARVQSFLDGVGDARAGEPSATRGGEHTGAPTTAATGATQTGATQTGAPTAPGHSALVSRDATMTYLTVQFRAGSPKQHQDAARRLSTRLRDAPGVTLGGPDISFVWGNQTVQSDLRRAQLIALPILLVLLLLFFRGAVAGMLPLVIGGLTILLTELALRVASSLTSISIFTLSVVSALGLGLAIDYSLLIVSRYREELATTPQDPTTALHRTMTSAGRTVCFSACTVAAALASLLVFPQPYFFSMGLAGAIVVLLTCASAITVLPALLALLGHRINALAPARLQTPTTHNTAAAENRGRWYRLARTVMRHPIATALTAAAILVAIASPALTIKLTTANAHTLPRSASPRQVSDALQRDFQADPSQNIIILSTGPQGQALRRYRATLAKLPDVAALAPPQRLTPTLGLLQLTPAEPALSPATQRLVSHIQALRPPFATMLTGETAGFTDLKHSLAARAPIAIGLVIAITTIAIFLMTGSAILPLKTLLMNALTIGAAYGIMVFIFQDGRLQGPLAYESSHAIDVTQPLVMLAVVFGLSTDYGVFLLDRIRELHRQGLPNQQAVALGLQRTGRIITSAALLLCVAIGAIATSHLVEVKEVAVGIAAAILIDATIVRSLLVPALMRLLGDLNWWRPALAGRRAASRDH